MKIKEDVSLADYSTMRLGGKAKYLCEVTSEVELEEAATSAKQKDLTVHVVGGGSNSIFSDEGFDGLVIVNRITGLRVTGDSTETELTIGAGEKWDDVVKKSVELGFTDIAALSLIPGSAGGAPVQNIGAYGQQISESLISVRAFDLDKSEWITFLRSSCNFSYRSSRFNNKDKGKFIIASLKLRLSRKIEKAPFYSDVERYFEIHGIGTASVSPDNLREAVTSIRSAKLPDPEIVANTGSFFKNPIVTEDSFKELSKHYSGLKVHKTDDGKMKLYAGQLIELAGMKNYHDKQTGMATWKNQV